MENKLVKCQRFSGTPVWININNIIFYQKYLGHSENMETEIHFVDGAVLVVRETCNELAALIEEKEI